MNTDDTIAAYNKMAKEYADSLRPKNADEPLARFAGRLPRPAKALDIGCAGGRDTQTLHNAGLDVTGVEAAGKLLDIARADHPDLSFVQADMRTLPFAEESIDGIWANAVVHHLGREDIPAALAEFGRVLKSGGVLFVHTKQGTGTLTDEVFGAERKFTLLEPDELSGMLTDAGFGSIEHVTRKSRSRDLYWINATAKKL